jgi:hypothetical protein
VLKTLLAPFLASTRGAREVIPAILGFLDHSSKGLDMERRNS